ncbi:hypothetical protein [Paenibacillus sp. 1781tsa1]|uniref:hypothetical protein n=1 Tax=Paenibacillus sp. 1781tsa1 TaxID=2953810 RepID=UPI0020A0288B|nr:hypothetical protein [Paenibacillus sp. 1781tsa1]MCP1184936.1 hypothetical protein [Paenibacillus sp. 1781tsa1]
MREAESIEMFNTESKWHSNMLEIFLNVNFTFIPWEKFLAEVGIAAEEIESVGISPPHTEDFFDWKTHQFTTENFVVEIKGKILSDCFNAGLYRQKQGLERLYLVFDVLDHNRNIVKIDHTSKAGINYSIDIRGVLLSEKGDYVI